MKKIRKSIIAISCATLMSFGLFACSDEVSAYEIAVKNGFVGTEQEWLRSLHGADGEDGEDLDMSDLYETAKNEYGFQGSYLDFCKELGIEAQLNNDTQTIAKNITSVVSICCGFSKSAGGPLNKTEYYMSAGSGVIVDLNENAGTAYVVTNYHVIYDADSNEKGISNSIYLYTYGAYNRFVPGTGDEYGDGLKATYVGGAMQYDIAILKVEGSEFLKNAAAKDTVNAAEFGDSETIREGESVFAIGNPDAAGISVTSGVVSVKSEYISMYLADGGSATDFRVIRTDAAINHGNSGGALFNAKGELIGITNAKNVSEDVDNMGYALPITQVKYLCQNIWANGGQTNKGVVKRAMLGVMVSTSASEAKLTADGHLEIYEKFGVYQAAGAGSAAYNKLIENDVFKYMIVNDGERVDFTRQYQLNDMLLTVKKGDTVVIGFERGGAPMEATIVYNKDAYFTVYD